MRYVCVRVCVCCTTLYDVQATSLFYCTDECRFSTGILRAIITAIASLDNLIDSMAFVLLNMSKSFCLNIFLCKRFEIRLWKILPQTPCVVFRFNQDPATICIVTRKLNTPNWYTNVIVAIVS